MPLGGDRKVMDLEELRVARDKESRAVVDEIQRWMLAQECVPGGIHAAAPPGPPE